MLLIIEVVNVFLIMKVAAMTVSRTSITAVVGKNVTFPCKNNGSSVWWETLDPRNRHPIKIHDGLRLNPHPRFSRFHVTIDETNNLKSLVIVTVQMNDSGTYACQIRGNSTMATELFSLDVVAVSGPSNSAVVVGSTVRLDCTTDRPNTTVCWHYVNDSTTGLPETIQSEYKLGERFKPRFSVESEWIDDRAQRSTLVINSVQLQDAGLYYCRECRRSGDYKRGSELTVIEPTCWTKKNADDFEYFEIGCNVNYRGVWRPIVQCLPEAPENITNESFTSEIVTYRKVVASTDVEQNQTQYRCTMSFNATQNRRTSAGNIPRDIDLWMSPDEGVTCPSCTTTTNIVLTESIADDWQRQSDFTTANATFNDNTSETWTGFAASEANRVPGTSSMMTTTILSALLGAACLGAVFFLIRFLQMKRKNTEASVAPRRHVSRGPYEELRLETREPDNDYVEIVPDDEDVQGGSTERSCWDVVCTKETRR